jgi:Zn-dependent protease
VAVAGPAANLLMALFWALVLKTAILLGDDAGFAVPMALMGKTGIGINCLLMVLNLLPILPLDGGRIVDSFLPARWSVKFAALEPYGMLILLLLLTTGLLGQVLTVPNHLIQSMIYAIIGL